MSAQALSCRKCGRGNPEDAAFCGDCGASLGPETRCPRCQRRHPVGQKFCHGCAFPLSESSAPEIDRRAYTPKHLVDKILQSKSALEGERKQVTVLFADVKGSMELAEQLDPEEWHRILERFFAVLTDGVHRFEGTVNQYTGDGIMALFGAPIAHEDHAQRACYAGLWLRDALREHARAVERERGLSFSVRIGLNSGEVVVGKIGDDLRMDYTAQGHTVGLAARIEQCAEPGSVYLSEDTARLVDGYCRYEDVGTFRFKGAGAPVRLFRLGERIELRSRFDLAVRRGLTRFVGRNAELDQLEGSLASAVAGRGSTVALSGEAGVGKSRLCYEFAARCRARGIPVAYAQAFDHGDGASFVTALDLLRETFAVSTADSPAEVRTRITALVPAAETDLAVRLSLFFEFLGVADPETPAWITDPADRNAQLLDVIRELIRRRGTAGPLLILLEDLHWLDGGSAAVVDAIVRGARGTRILFLCNFRPGFDPEWVGRAGCKQIRLAPLDASESAELARSLLGDDPRAGLAAFVGERAGGNPFFAEEIVRSLSERRPHSDEAGREPSTEALKDLAIPPRVESLIAARIDRLPELAKSVLHDAAVIGRMVPRDLLAQVSRLEQGPLDDATDLLTRSGFLLEAARAENTTYAFAHPLTHSVAYRTQLAELRRERHLRAATALEVSLAVAERPGESAALLERHWENAGDPLRAAQAGARLARWLANSDARRGFAQWSKVRTVAAGLPESELSLTLTLRACAAMLRFGWRQGLEREEAERLFEQARGIARRLGDVRTETFLTNSYGRMMGTIDGAEAYLRYAHESTRLSEGVDDGGLRVVVDVARCQALGWVGRLGESLALAEDILGLHEADVAAAARHLGFSARVWARALRGWLLTDLGRLSEGEADLQEAMQISRDQGQFDILAMASRTYVSLQWILGDVDTAMREATAAVSNAESLGTPYSLVGAYWSLGRALLMQERGEDAAAALERALSIATRCNVYLEFEGSMLALLAEAERASFERSRALAERAVSAARRRKMRVSECEALLSLGRVLLRGEGEREREAAGQALGGVLELVEQNSARPLSALASVELAQLARLRGDASGAGLHETRARTAFLAMSARRRAETLRPGS